MKFMIAGRREGKTCELVRWALEGHETNSYPFWSRVILTCSISRADQIRKDYPELDYRQVFSMHEWMHARLGKSIKPVEIGIDDINDYLAHEFGNVTFVTASGELHG